MKNNNESKILTRIFLSLIPVQALAIGLPSVCTLLNGFIIGNYLHEEALSAVGFSSPLIMTVTALCGLLSAGVQVVCGNCIANGDKDGMNKTYNTSMFLCVVMGLVLLVISVAVPDAISLLLGATGEMTAYVSQYIRGYGIGIPFLFIYSCTLNYLQLERLDKTITFTTVLTVLISVGGNIINVLYLNLGIFGSGLFLSLANIVSCVISVAVILIKDNSYSLSVKSINRNFGIRIISKGSVQAVNSFCDVVRIAVVNIFIYKLCGTVGMSAFTISTDITKAFGGLILAGYFGASKTLASVFTGYRYTETLRKIAKIISKWGFIIFTASYIIVFVFAEPIALLFGADAANISIYRDVIRFGNMWSIFIFDIGAPFCIYQVMGKTKLMNIIAIICNCALPILSCILFADIFGINFMAFVSTLSNIFYAFAFLIIYIVKAHKLPKSIFELCYIPSSESIPADNRFQATVCNVEEATEISGKVEQFCLIKGISKKKAYYCALCIEEMAVDTVVNRFKNNKNTVDIQIIYEDGDLHLMFRDDCTTFDPNAWLKLCNPKDEYRSIGIKTVSAISKEMNYINTLGMNLLTVEL